MEEREGDLTSKHATGCLSLTKNNERLDWKDENTRLACIGQVGSCLSLLEAIYLSWRKKGIKRKNQRKQQEVLPSYHPVFGLPFIHYPLFAWGPQNKEILLNLGMKSWDSAFNAQGSIAIVQVGGVKVVSYIN